MLHNTFRDCVAVIVDDYQKLGPSRKLFIDGASLPEKPSAESTEIVSGTLAVMTIQ